MYVYPKMKGKEKVEKWKQQKFKCQNLHKE